MLGKRFMHGAQMLFKHSSAIPCGPAPELLLYEMCRVFFLASWCAIPKSVISFSTLDRLREPAAVVEDIHNSPHKGIGVMVFYRICYNNCYF